MAPDPLPAFCWYRIGFLRNCPANYHNTSGTDSVNHSFSILNLIKQQCFDTKIHKTIQPTISPHISKTSLPGFQIQDTVSLTKALAICSVITNWICLKLSRIIRIYPSTEWSQMDLCDLGGSKRRRPGSPSVVRLPQKIRTTFQLNPIRGKLSCKLEDVYALNRPGSFHFESHLQIPEFWRRMDDLLNIYTCLISFHFPLHSPNWCLSTYQQLWGAYFMFLIRLSVWWPLKGLQIKSFGNWRHLESFHPLQWQCAKNRTYADISKQQFWKTVVFQNCCVLTSA